MGSAVFNILVITGLSAIARPANITWHVVLRDIVAYVLSVGALLLIFLDGRVILLEALALLVLYGLYLLLLFNWNALTNDAAVDAIELVESDLAEKHKGKGWFAHLSLWIVRGLGLLAGDAHRQFGRTFVVSIALISLISWFLVHAAVAFAEAIRVPPVLIALTVLAGGTSVPDLFASVAVANEGRGDMAVANAVGSNIFDILIGLGLPWALIMVLQGGDVQVGTDDLWQATVALLGTVILLFIFLTTDRRLSRREGWLLLATYAAFVLWMWWG